MRTFRDVLPLSEEIDHELPAPDVIAAVLGVAGVLDKSKLGAAADDARQVECSQCLIETPD